MIYGNTTGIKTIKLQELENLIREYPRHSIIDRELLDRLAVFSHELSREICVFISRGGSLLSVGIGDSGTVGLQDINLRRSEDRLTGVRCFHTHPNGDSRLSEMDISALKKNRYDLLAAIGVKGGNVTGITVGYLKDIENIACIAYRSKEDLDDGQLFNKITEADNNLKNAELKFNKAEIENALLVVVTKKGGTGPEVLIAELQRLADTAGLKTVKTVSQTREGIDRAYCIGRGKLEEVRRYIQVLGVDIVIFDHELSGSQLNNLEETLGVKIIDRSMLILEIFAKHATSNEGKLQVELARKKYTLPKLLGQGKALSRIGGGAGTYTKGAGETKLETDRRQIKREIHELTERIRKLESERDLRRERRLLSKVKNVVIVGYTNAGKSTLMNLLTKSDVLVEDKLFATLDPVTRKIWVDIGKEYLLTDTVGFIDRLPHEFIDAFKSTLEEAKYADLLLHVADASGNDLNRQYGVVMDVLKSLGVNKPVVTVYNKIDLRDENAAPYPVLEDYAEISALLGTGIDGLRDMIASKLF